MHTVQSGSQRLSLTLCGNVCVLFCLMMSLVFVRAPLKCSTNSTAWRYPTGDTAV